MLSLGSHSPSPLPPVPPDAPALVVYTRDLMLESRLAADAQKNGWRFWAEARPVVPPSRFEPADYRLALFDLTLGIDSLPPLLAFWQTERQVPVLAFGSHVDTLGLQTADQLGCREVWTRGRLHAQFTQFLSDPLLSRHTGSTPAPPST